MAPIAPTLVITRGAPATINDGRSGDVSVIDVTKLAITRTIETGDSPWGVAVAKDAQ